MATLFDCDGTLVDSESLMSEVLAQLLSEQGIVFHASQALEQFRGVRMATCLAGIEQHTGRKLPAGFEAEFRRRMTAAFHERIQPMPGALELVQQAAPPIAVVSSGPLEKIRLTLRLTGLLDYFEGRLFSGYDVQSWKPDPELFLHAARSLNVHPGHCNVVEDSITGVRAALAAGMNVFAFQPQGRHPELPEHVPSVSQLSELIPKLRTAAASR
jgi:HAD superfamily hydrolase (TIGR01509 family)